MYSEGEYIRTLIEYTKVSGLSIYSVDEYNKSVGEYSKSVGEYRNTVEVYRNTVEVYRILEN